MVKPFNRSGQRGRKKSFRRMRGRFGSSRVASPAIATAAAAAAARRNWRLVVGIKGNETYSGDIRMLFQHNRNGLIHGNMLRIRIELKDQLNASRRNIANDQKLKVTCRSMRRFAEEFEKPPPW